MNHKAYTNYKVSGGFFLPFQAGQILKMAGMACHLILSHYLMGPILKGSLGFLVMKRAPA